jgi:hypothetical protein
MLRPVAILSMKKTKKWRTTWRVLCGLVLLYGIASAGLYVAMKQPPEAFGAIMAKVPMVSMIILPFEPLWMSARKGTLEAGDTAPDFALPSLDGSHVVSLAAEMRERPVVLIFGSYT